MSFFSSSSTITLSRLSLQLRACRFPRFFSTERNEAHRLLLKIRERISARGIFQRIEELDQQLKNPELWAVASRGSKVSKEHGNLVKLKQRLESLEEKLKEGIQIFEEGKEDEEFRREGDRIIAEVLEEGRLFEFETLMMDESDSNPCFVEFQAGAGGTESMDWAEMLLRMYSNWAIWKNFNLELIEESHGEIAGLKSACIKIDGDRAFGWMKHESGVHRLVRISPFDSNARRHTSFATVFVYPVKEESESKIDPSELRIETMRSSGPGGQHVNKTESAVRITHIPSGIVVKAQTKSQHRNRQIAMEVLQARLQNLDTAKKQEAQQAARQSLGESSWGNQCRSYVLHPYQMVKDVRSGVESHAAAELLKGGEAFDRFIRECLSERNKKKN